jgi:hypothetical protein
MARRIGVLIGMISKPGEAEQCQVAVVLTRIRSVGEVTGMVTSDGIVGPDPICLSDQTMGLGRMLKPRVGCGEEEGIVGARARPGIRICSQCALRPDNRIFVPPDYQHCHSQVTATNPEVRTARVEPDRLFEHRDRFRHPAQPGQTIANSTINSRVRISVKDTLIRNDRFGTAILDAQQEASGHKYAFIIRVDRRCIGEELGRPPDVVAMVLGFDRCFEQ